MIHPILIWPFSKPTSPSHCEALIDFFKQLEGERDLGRITVVVNHCAKKWLIGSHARNLENADRNGWQIRWVWSVDTCQTWLDAFGSAYFSSFGSPFAERSGTKGFRGHGRDSKCLYVIIPADFHYATRDGTNALKRVYNELQRATATRHQICLGQLQPKGRTFKTLVDELGTWKLLDLWFPREANLLREKQILRPCSEFLALSDKYLEGALKSRWFAYSQTLVMLVRAAQSRSIDRIRVYDIGELAEDPPLEPFQELLTQLERTERVLKVCWRTSKRGPSIWQEQYACIAQQSHLCLDHIIRSCRAGIFA